MNTLDNVIDDELLACEICLQQVPISEAKSEEASEYVMHYWGLECYMLWANQQINEEN